MDLLISTFITLVLLCECISSQFIKRSSSGDEIYAGKLPCLDCASIFGSSGPKQCSTVCKCQKEGTLLPHYGMKRFLTCFKPERTSISVTYGCTLNLLTQENSIPTLSSRDSSVALIAEAGRGDLARCQLNAESSVYWTPSGWKPLYDSKRHVSDFHLQSFRGKLFIQWKKQSSSYSGMLAKLGITCFGMTSSCVLVKFKGKSEDNLSNRIINVKSSSTIHSVLRKRRNVNSTNNTNITNPTVKLNGSTPATLGPSVAPVNGTDPTEGEKEDNKVLFYLAMVCGAAITLVVIPVIAIAINNRRKKRKLKKILSQKKFADENDNNSNGEIYVIPSDRRSRSSTITVNVEDTAGSNLSSVRSSRRGSLDPSAVNDLRRQSLTSLQIQQNFQNMRRGSAADIRPRSVSDMRPVLEHRPRSFSELRTLEKGGLDLRRQSLSNLRNSNPLTPDFRRSSVSDPRLQRLNPNVINMAGIEESEKEIEDAAIYRRMDPRKNSDVSLRPSVSTSDIPDAGQKYDDGRKRSRTLSKLLDPADVANAVGENKFSPRPCRKISSVESSEENRGSNSKESDGSSQEPKGVESGENGEARKISSSDTVLPYASMSIPPRKLSLSLPDKDYDHDDVFDKLKTPNTPNPNEPSYTKFFIS